MTDLPANAAILDENIDRLELSMRTVNALKKRFGDRVLVRELAMFSEDQIRTELQSYHKKPNIFVVDINSGLAKYSLALGTSWAEMPPSRHAEVRNPQQMSVKRERETSIRFREPKEGGVFVSVVVTLEGDRTRILLRETECPDQNTAVELGLGMYGKSNEYILALPYRDD